MESEKKNYNVESNPDEKVEKTYEAFKGELALKVEKENGRVPDFSYFYQQNREKDTGGVKETHIEETQQQYSTLPYQMATGVIRSVPESISASKQPNEMRLHVRNRHEENNSQATALDEMRNDSTSEVLYGDHDAVETNDSQSENTVAETNDIVESVDIEKTAIIESASRTDKGYIIDGQLTEAIRKLLGDNLKQTLFWEDIYACLVKEYYTSPEQKVNGLYVAKRMKALAEKYGIKSGMALKSGHKSELKTYTDFGNLFDAE